MSGPADTTTKEVTLSHQRYMISHDSPDSFGLPGPTGRVLAEADIPAHLELGRLLKSGAIRSLAPGDDPPQLAGSVRFEVLHENPSTLGLTVKRGDVITAAELHNFDVERLVRVGAVRRLAPDELPARVAPPGRYFTVRTESFGQLGNVKGQSFPVEVLGADADLDRLVNNGSIYIDGHEGSPRREYR